MDYRVYERPDVAHGRFHHINQCYFRYFNWRCLLVRRSKRWSGSTDQPAVLHHHYPRADCDTQQDHVWRRESDDRGGCSEENGRHLKQKTSAGGNDEAGDSGVFRYIAERVFSLWKRRARCPASDQSQHQRRRACRFRRAFRRRKDDVSQPDCPFLWCYGRENQHRRCGRKGYSFRTADGYGIFRVPGQQTVENVNLW